VTCPTQRGAENNRLAKNLTKFYDGPWTLGKKLMEHLANRNMQIKFRVSVKIKTK